MLYLLNPKTRSFKEKNAKRTIIGDSINQNFKYVPPPLRKGQAVNELMYSFKP